MGVEWILVLFCSVNIVLIKSLLNSILFIEILTILVLIWFVLGNFNIGIFILARIAAIGAAIRVRLINNILRESRRRIV